MKYIDRLYRLIVPNSLNVFPHYAPEFYYKGVWYFGGTFVNFPLCGDGSLIRPDSILEKG